MLMRKWMFLAALLYLGASGVQKAAAQSGTTSLKYPNITCASDDMRRHYCRIDTQGRVRMVNQRSGSPCIQGQTWGFDNSGIWVDRGCRADFVVGPWRRQRLSSSSAQARQRLLSSATSSRTASGRNGHLLLEQYEAEFLPGVYRPRRQAGESAQRFRVRAGANLGME